MNNYIRCKLFGHKFVGVIKKFQGDKIITEKIAMDSCVYCGLSKKDLLSITCK